MKPELAAQQPAENFEIELDEEVWGESPSDQAEKPEGRVEPEQRAEPQIEVEDPIWGAQIEVEDNI